MGTPPNAQIAYLELASRMNPPGPPDDPLSFRRGGGRLERETPAAAPAGPTRHLGTRRNLARLAEQITREPDPERKQPLVTALEAEVRRLAPRTRGPDARGLGF